MSDYTVISAVSSTLQTLLTNNITNALAVPLNVPIQLYSPPEMDTVGQVPGISLWLYKVTRMAEMLNEPPERKSATQLAPTPLPVLPHYLVTSIATSPL